MKKLFTTLIMVLFGIVILAACTNTGSDNSMSNEKEPTFPTDEQASRVLPSLTFSSLDDFLNAYLIAKEGNDVGDLLGFNDSELREEDTKSIIEKINFTALETFYLPVGIPENFIIRRIIVGENGMGFIYLSEDVEFTSDTFWITELNNPSFKLSVYMNSRFNMNDILRDENKTIDDLINGKYLIDEPNLFTWEENGIIFVFHTPSPSDDGIEADSIYDMIRFTEMETVSLSDINRVSELIEESASRREAEAVQGNERAVGDSLGE